MKTGTLYAHAFFVSCLQIQSLWYINKHNSARVLHLNGQQGRFGATCLALEWDKLLSAIYFWGWQWGVSTISGCGDLQIEREVGYNNLLMGVLKGVVHRAHVMCDLKDLLEALNLLKNVFISNGCPE